MKKRFLSLLFALSLLILPTHAAENSMDNFVRGSNDLVYTDQFSDVPEDSVFYPHVAALYEYGLTKGKTDGTFGLKDSVSVSQVIIFAGRIRSLYRTGDPEAGPTAFQTNESQATCMPYLTYLKSEDVLDNALDDALFTPATRAQMAHVLAKILPEDALPPINHDLITEAYATHRFIPDVDEYTPYQQDILYLYRCGISHGNDENGSFYPDQPITRGAVAAMLTRMVTPSLRIQLEWRKFNVPDISHLTLADLVEPGRYIPSPETEEEIDECVRYMLSSGSNTMVLEQPGVTFVQARKKMEQVMAIVKTYAEQSYNAVSCSFPSKDQLQLTFSATFAGSDSLEYYRQESLTAAKAIHDSLWADGYLTEDMTDLDKAYLYYIWICLNSTYDHDAQDDALSHTPYSLFRLGKAVCDGYTGAYNLLLKLEGISCSTYSTDSHIWTVATLDGTKYHIDTTWGDNGDSANPLCFAMTPEQSFKIHGISV